MTLTHTPQAMNRRAALKTTIGLGALAAGSLRMPAAQAAVPLTRIDVHAHVIPSFYRQAFQASAAATSGVTLPAWSVASAVTFMDKFGIQAQVVSLPEPGLSFLPDLAARVQLARQLNDYVRDELVQAAPGTLPHGRFGGFATLPLGDPNNDKDVDAACAEAIRALTVLRLDGVVLYTSYQGVYLGDSKLAPLMSTLNLLGAHVMVQAATPPVRPDLPMPVSVLEAPFEITRAATNMLYKSVYLLYPRIQWQLAEGGGTTPFLSYRSGLLALNLNPSRSSYARLYFDTASATAPATVAAIRQITDTSHILLGTDFPHTSAVFAGQPAGDPAPALNASFTTTERPLIDRGNALELLPRLANRLDNR